MITYIEPVHEETISSDESKTLGVLYNYNSTKEFKDSLIYIYNKKNYIFFETIIDMFDYLYYGDKTNVKRAYMPEPTFDEYLDKNVNGIFSEHLTWLNGE